MVKFAKFVHNTRTMKPRHAGGDYSTAHGPFIEGERLIFGKITIPAGTKADGELAAEDTEDEKIEVEKALGNAQEGGRDGAGEAALDSPPPD